MIGNDSNHRKWERRERILDEIETSGYCTVEGIWLGHTSTITVGFSRLNHPELMFTHLHTHVVEHLAATFFSLIKDGWVFEHGDLVEGLIPAYPMAVIAVPEGHYIDVHSDVFITPLPSMLQIQSPDRSSRFPWDPGSDIAGHWYVTPLPTQWRERDLGAEIGDIRPGGRSGL